jgi:hypothetical protein
MDGPFFSIFPYENKDGSKLYTLTHVKYGVIQSSIVDLKKVNELFSHILAECLFYLPGFFSAIELVDFFISKKSKPYSKSESRAVHVERNCNIIQVKSGKIDAIFSAEVQVAKILNEILN